MNLRSAELLDDKMLDIAKFLMANNEKADVIFYCLEASIDHT
jgi:hypothetical protein